VKDRHSVSFAKLTFPTQDVQYLLSGRRQTVSSRVCSSAVASPSISACWSEWRIFRTFMV